jgi:hypothetical protein
MSKGAHVVFALVIKFLNEKRLSQHIIIGLFKANETTKRALARNLIKLLDQYDLRKKIVTYVKGEGANFNAITTTLKFVVNYEVFGMEESFQGICFGHAFFKACQYRIVEIFFCKSLKYISIMLAQFDLQKCIT